MTGDLLALVAAFFWSAANVTIARGAGGKGDDNGAFLAILLTAGIAGAIWVIQGLHRGWSTLDTMGMLWFAAAGVLTIFIGRVLFHSSIQYLGAVRGSSVKRLAPVFSVMLGVTMLGERLDTAMVVGMVMIFSGFGLLVHESISSRESGDSVARIEDNSGVGRWVNRGIVYGAVSSVAYALGNVARKYGLNHMPDPAFGVMFASMVGALLFLLMATVAQSYRNAVRSTFTRFNPWLFAAGVLASVGQLLYFIAIDYSTISRVTLIVSLEVFVTIFLMVVVFRSREKMTPAALVAAALGVTGTVVILLGGT